MSVYGIGMSKLKTYLTKIIHMGKHLVCCTPLNVAMQRDAAWRINPTLDLKRFEIFNPLACALNLFDR